MKKFIIACINFQRQQRKKNMKKISIAILFGSSVRCHRATPTSPIVLPKILQPATCHLSADRRVSDHRWPPRCVAQY